MALNFSPTWINKLPSAPPIYGGHHGSSLGFIPIMMDFGVQLRGGSSIGGMRWNYAIYSTNGPRAVSSGDIAAQTEEGHGDEHLSLPALEGAPGTRAAEGHEEGGGGTSGSVDWGPWGSDDNNNKAGGLRLGFLPSRSIEVGLSLYRATITYQGFEASNQPAGDKAEGDIALTLVDLTFYGDKFRLEGEYLVEDASGIDAYVTASQTDAAGMIDTEKLLPADERSGYWVQGSYNFGGWLPEAVLRYGAVSVEGHEIGSETAVGANWWLESSLILKAAAVATTVEEAGADVTTTDYYLQLAFGF